ncbi:cyclic lactone autoinducer peptide [Anaerobacterium chartisolvens]|uniref:Cyclic lactone autoinducer peptide n=1 Tax=Anaerobacterium chartisolvens TaxID=1297424 RepID=A0A369BAG2_9FIRM|nr:cyclic lactone autoinducer peptide [Anaerobacterium chartisolvens]RCX18391.1 cyclic lactone autoinducer peptide [Anaerobacterium chartisolvens]
MKQPLIYKIYSVAAALLVVIAASVASSATWFMFYQPREPACLKRMN